MNRLVPTLFRIALSSLHVALGHSAGALDDVPGIAAVSASDQGAMPNTAAHGVATGAPRRTLDLRPAALQSLHIQNLQQVVISADPEEAVNGSKLHAMAADVLDSQWQDEHFRPYEKTVRFSLAGIPCRPAKVTLRTAPRFIYTVLIPAVNGRAR